MNPTVPTPTPTTDNIIEVKDLTVGYGSNIVLQNLNFSVKRGEVFVILGGSGCGKSSLLKNMIGLYDPPMGSVLIEGQNIVTAFGAERQNILTRFGVMYQQGALFGSMTLLENVRLFLEEYTQLQESEMSLIARCKLDLVGLLPFEAFMPSEISGGMQKRAAIARAMALIFFFSMNLRPASIRLPLLNWTRRFSRSLVILALPLWL